MIYCVQALSIELNKELKLDEARKPISKPKSKPRCKSAITRSQKCKYQLSKLQIPRARVANTRRRGKDRLLFNPKYLQDENKSQRRITNSWIKDLGSR